MAKRVLVLTVLLSVLFVARYAMADLPGATHITINPVSSSEIDLSWTAAGVTPAITSYRIARESPAGNGGFTTIIASQTSSSYVDAGLAPNTTYGYKVYAINSDGEGSPGYVTGGTLLAAVPYPPDRPTNLKATAISANKIDLSWTAANSVSVITGYRIDREISIGGGFTTIVANTNSAATSYADTNLSSGVVYNYRLMAFNINGQSQLSLSAFAMTYTVPIAPASVKAMAGDGQVTVSWTPPDFTGGGITGYVITGPTPSSSASVGWNATSTIITGLTNGITYYFSVNAINPAGQGSSIKTDPVVPTATPKLASGTTVQTTYAPTPIPTSTFFFSTNLYRGLRGKSVQELQKRLLHDGFFKGDITGYFGVVTEAAVKAYQRARGISPVGSLGPITRARLNKSL